jgi:tRNA A-37 threonylcarbamoyl transferase component Bud32
MSSIAYIRQLIEDTNTLLNSALTGTSFIDLNDEYIRFRKKILNLEPFLGQPPDFLSNADSLWDLWHKYIKNNYPNYQTRRDFVRMNFYDYYINIIDKFKYYPFEQELTFRDIYIEEEIDRGGSGIIYKANHLILDRPLVIKKLNPLFANESEEIIALRRFIREINILSSLHHPNIISVFDAGIAEGYPYIIMNYVDGKNLDKEIQLNGVMNIKVANCIIIQILDAICTAHQVGIIHRDIKPRNIIWNGEKITILDFGSGQWLEHILTTRFTSIPQGTIGYIAPELYDDPKLLNPNLDCYSVGILYHFILTGRTINTGDPKYFLKEKNIDENVIEFIIKTIAPPEIRFKDGMEMKNEFKNVLRCLE